jgi:hypothetical protein
MDLLNCNFCRIIQYVATVKFGNCMYQNFQYETGSVSFKCYQHASTCMIYVPHFLKMAIIYLTNTESKLIFGLQASWGSVIDKVESS